ncbi:helix-turn-helix domain-containing protein [Mycobacterium sp. NS-7484]|uniref:helix-turn-helix domain-containing protein n=1 Tax=Mycobacterium sp. NS-7484 TaxID=1834161 RepID=UPI0013014C65|nr:helix-turn-helix transcriptional regulator [Mycobacterium sp. NS-7484]
MAGDAAAEYFGRALAAARSERGLKRMQLKEQSGLSYPYISEIENGGKYPSQRAIQSLADALDMTPSELVARAEQLEAVDLSGRPAALADSFVDDLARGIWGPVRSGDDNLVQRLTEQVMQAIEVPLRDLVAREVQMTIREELLRQRDGK